VTTGLGKRRHCRGCDCDAGKHANPPSWISREKAGERVTRQQDLGKGDIFGDVIVMQVSTQIRHLESARRKPGRGSRDQRTREKTT
jgi:hypothetical protein